MGDAINKPATATIIPFPEPVDRKAFILENEEFLDNVSSIRNIDTIKSLDAVEDMMYKDEVYKYSPNIIFFRIVPVTRKLITTIFDDYKTEGELKITIGENSHTYNWRINFTDTSGCDISLETAMASEDINRQLVYLLPGFYR